MVIFGIQMVLITYLKADEALVLITSILLKSTILAMI